MCSCSECVYECKHVESSAIEHYNFTKTDGQLSVQIPTIDFHFGDSVNPLISALPRLFEETVIPYPRILTECFSRTHRAFY
jgi:hypothetical protein